MEVPLPPTMPAARMDAFGLPTPFLADGVGLIFQRSRPSSAGPAVGRGAAAASALGVQDTTVQMGSAADLAEYEEKRRLQQQVVALRREVGEQQEKWNDLRKQAALREAELAELQALTTYGQEELGEEDEERTVLHALQAAAVAEQEQKDAQMVEEEWRRQQYNFLEKRELATVAKMSAAVSVLKRALALATTRRTEAFKKREDVRSEVKQVQSQLARFKHSVERRRTQGAEQLARLRTEYDEQRNQQREYAEWVQRQQEALASSVEHEAKAIADKTASVRSRSAKVDAMLLNEQMRAKQLTEALGKLMELSATRSLDELCERLLAGGEASAANGDAASGAASAAAAPGKGKGKGRASGIFDAAHQMMLQTRREGEARLSRLVGELGETTREHEAIFGTPLESEQERERERHELFQRHDARLAAAQDALRTARSRSDRMERLICAAWAATDHLAHMVRGALPASAGAADEPAPAPASSAAASATAAATAVAAAAAAGGEPPSNPSADPTATAAAGAHLVQAPAALSRFASAEAASEAALGSLATAERRLLALLEAADVATRRSLAAAAASGSGSQRGCGSAAAGSLAAAAALAHSKQQPLSVFSRLNSDAKASKAPSRLSTRRLGASSSSPTDSTTTVATACSGEQPRPRRVGSCGCDASAAAGAAASAATFLTAADDADDADPAGGSGSGGGARSGGPGGRPSLGGASAAQPLRSSRQRPSTAPPGGSRGGQNHQKLHVAIDAQAHAAHVALLTKQLPRALEEAVAARQKDSRNLRLGATLGTPPPTPPKVSPRSDLEQEAAFLRDVFAAFDSDASGQIAVSEVRQLFERVEHERRARRNAKVGGGARPAYVGGSCRRLQIGASGVVGAAAAAERPVKRRLGTTERAAATFVLSLFDRDENGTLDASEMGRFFAIFDAKDGNKLISWDEFYSAAASLLDGVRRREKAKEEAINYVPLAHEIKARADPHARRRLDRDRDARECGVQLDPATASSLRRSLSQDGAGAGADGGGVCGDDQGIAGSPAWASPGARRAADESQLQEPQDGGNNRRPSSAAARRPSQARRAPGGRQPDLTPEAAAAAAAATAALPSGRRGLVQRGPSRKVGMNSTELETAYGVSPRGSRRRARRQVEESEEESGGGSERSPSWGARPPHLA